jgi:hypothetical protein
MDTLWGLAEEKPSWDESRKTLGIDPKHLDELLEGITFALARAADNDTIYPVVEGSLRVAKVGVRGSDTVLRVWYTLDRTKRLACLHVVDVEPSDTEEDLPW